MSHKLTLHDYMCLLMSLHIMSHMLTLHDYICLLMSLHIMSHMLTLHDYICLLMSLHIMSHMLTLHDYICLLMSLHIMSHMLTHDDYLQVLNACEVEIIVSPTFNSQQGSPSQDKVSQLQKHDLFITFKTMCAISEVQLYLCIYRQGQSTSTA
jgi:hypothetical protein